MLRSCAFVLPRRVFHPPRRAFTVLAIESSADDTCAAIVCSNRKVLSNVIVKQHNLHLEYGGIHPQVAMRAHQSNMPGAVVRCLTEAGLKIEDVDGIAFTRGPGLGSCLSVACNAAKTLAAVHNKPIVGVHHMQAHALTACLTSSPPPQFPFLTLLVSGGHSMIVLATSPVNFRVLATTLDKSIGSLIDRVATLLEIKWSDMGPGPALEAFCAEEGDDGDDGLDFNMPRIVMRGEMALSFSGFHNAVYRAVTAAGGVENLNKRALARAFQTSIFAHLEDKLALALRWCANNGHSIHQVVVSGGVASNMFLRQRLKICLEQFDDMEAIFPPPALCTDNAVMIGWASMYRFLTQDYDDYTIGPRSEWSIEDLQNPTI
ncbi:glycoprotease [Mycena rebaudengoi]|nr:glycoprotease [Mycena rebaudengoi]